MDQETLEGIRQIVREELALALSREITIERGPRQQGDFEKVIREEKWNVLDFMVAYLPKVEGALRGVQEDTSKTANRVLLDFAPKIDALGQTILAMKQTAMFLAEVATVAKALGPLPHIEIAEKTGNEGNP